MKITVNSTHAAWTKVFELVNDHYSKSDYLSERAGYPVYTCENSSTTISDLNARIEINLEDGNTVTVWLEEEKHISVSNLTLSLYLEFVKPVCGVVLPLKLAEMLEHDMYVACMNAHLAQGKYAAIDEAIDLVRVIGVTLEYECQGENAKLTEQLENIRDGIQNRIDTAKAEKAVEAATKTIEDRKTRSAWDRGVKAYALELLEELADGIRDGYHNLTDLQSEKLLENALLNGAGDWANYSWGGCSLIYNRDIAERLCTPSELAKLTSGTGSEWYPKKPNTGEEWLDTQARALYQAAALVKNTVRALVA